MTRETILHLAVIVAVSSTIFFTSLGKARLWDRDEPRNAGCAAEMLQRGDWVVPIFNDELRHQKPVLLYWFMMAAYAAFGISEFAARFPSAIFGVGTALLTYGIARRLFDSSVALLSAVAISSSIMFCVAARAATPDSVLIFFSTLGIYFYAIGTFKISHSDGIALKSSGHWFPQQYIYVVLMNAAFGFAVLAKGPVGIVLPTAIIGMFLLIQRLQPMADEDKQTEGRLSRLIVSISRIINPIHFFKTCWSMRPLTAIAIVFLIAAPWYFAVGIQTNGDFTKLFFLNENFARATTVMENHSGSWLYYPATIAIGFFPWSIFLGPLLFAVDHQVSQKTKHAPAITFLACWVGVQVGLFSLAETKLPSYVTPCYPALAILTAYCLLRWLPAVSVIGVRWQYAALATLIAAGLVTSIGLGIAASKFFPQIWWIAGLGLIPIAGGLVAIQFVRNSSFPKVWISLATTSAAFCFLMFGVGTVAVDSTRQTHLLLDEVRFASSNQTIATYHCLESSWVFYAQRPIFELMRSAKGPGSIDSLDRESFWQKKPVISPEDFVAARPESMFITTDEHAEELLARLPREFGVSSEADFFLKEGRKLVLISKTANHSEQTARLSNADVR